MVDRLAEHRHVIYTLRDRSGVVLYVGRTAALNMRMAQHLEQQPWGDEVDWGRVEVEVLGPGLTAGEVEALEERRIRAAAPRYNRVHNADHFDARRYARAVHRRGLVRSPGAWRDPHGRTWLALWWRAERRRWRQGAVRWGPVAVVLAAVVGAGL